MSSPLAFPLAWPEHLPRAKDRRRSGAAVSLNRGHSDLMDSLRLLAADTGIPVRGVVVSSNVTLDDAKPADPGVAVYFVWDGARHCIAVDAFSSVEGNLRAIYQIVEGRRADLRHSGLEIVRAGLAGFRVPES